MVPEDINSFLLLENKHNDLMINLINQTINEELSIDNEQVKFSQNIFSYIEDLYNNGNFYTEDGYKMLRDIKTFNFIGSPILLCVTIYDYPTKVVKQKYSKLHKQRNSYLSSEDLLLITIKSVNGIYDKKYVYSTISHEITHAMQSIRNTYKSKVDVSDLYATACDNFYSSDDIIRSIASILYLSDKHEIEAFGNGLYSELTVTIKQNPDYDFKETSTYKQMLRLKDSINIVLSDAEATENKLKSIFNNGVTYKRLVDNGKWALNRMINKIGKVVTKVNKEYNNKMRY